MALVVKINVPNASKNHVKRIRALSAVNLVHMREKKHIQIALIVQIVLKTVNIVKTSIRVMFAMKDIFQRKTCMETFSVQHAQTIAKSAWLWVTLSCVKNVIEVIQTEKGTVFQIQKRVLVVV